MPAPADPTAPGAPATPSTPAPIVVSDMDGTLSTAETWRAIHEWVLATHPTPAARRFVTVRLPRVLLAKAGLIERERFRARWMEEQASLLRGVSEAGLAEMGEWVVEHHLWPARREAAVAAVRTAAGEARGTAPGARLVLATGGYQPVGDAFARRLGADVALGTPLEVRDGRATGAVLAPTQAGAQKAAAVRALAAGASVLAAFGDSAADIPLLAMAERAVAVAPDPALRREAVARGWEILEG